jgi:hypothetical protein
MIGPEFHWNGNGWDNYDTKDYLFKTPDNSNSWNGNGYSEHRNISADATDFWPGRDEDRMR